MTGKHSCKICFSIWPTTEQQLAYKWIVKRVEWIFGNLQGNLCNRENMFKQHVLQQDGANQNVIKKL